jgi:hypothetical protein
VPARNVAPAKEDDDDAWTAWHRPVISVMLAVPDATAAAEWYADALGAVASAPYGHVCLAGDRSPLGRH